MLGNMFGDLEEKQKEMKAKLSTIILESSAGEGAVKVKANANKEILNISIDPSLMEMNDIEQIEDLVLVAVNEAISLAVQKEQEESAALMKSMLPPGLGDLGGLFGK